MASVAALRIQPYPSETAVVRHDILGVPLTAIARTWSGGDHRRCRLCRDCPIRSSTASQEFCLVLVEEHVGDGEAPLYAKDRPPPVPAMLTVA